MLPLLDVSNCQCFNDINLRCHDLGPIQAILAELVDHCLVDGLTRVPLGDDDGLYGGDNVGSQGGSWRGEPVNRGSPSQP